MKKAISVTVLMLIFLSTGSLVFAQPLSAQPLSIEESFNTENSDFTYNGQAYRDNLNGLVNLSPCCYSGSVFYNNPINTAQFNASFDLEIIRLDSAGADGFTFAVIDSQDPTYLGGGGGGLGYSQTPPGQIGGFAIEFDVHKNNEEPDGNHIALMIAGDRLGSIYLTGDIPELEDNGMFHAEISLKGGKKLEIYLENESIGYTKRKVVDYTIEGMSPFKGLVGFTGGIGLFRSLFYVDNFKLQHSPLN